QIHTLSLHDALPIYTTGTGVPGWNDSVVPAPTCSGPRCGDHVVVPSVGSPSISPLASNSIGASTFKVTGCCMRTVVGSLNTGGEDRKSTRLNSSHVK